jgi:hypothetical protein
MKPAKHQYTILKQICNLIPAHLDAGVKLILFQ